jgi:predicted Zn-dependent protease
MFKYIIIFCAIISTQNAFASNGISLIRDAEIEKFLRELSDPIFKSADLNSKNIKIFIVNDNSINAFVSGGQNVFINTGLITKFKTPDALIGVISHEAGHIASSHIARSSEGSESAQSALIMSYLLGIGAAISGAPQASQAIIMSGMQTAGRLQMKYSRDQEEAADRDAVEYLSKMHYPANGLLSLLEFFEKEMIGYKDEINEYALSHPISRKRIDFLKNNMREKHFSSKNVNKKLQPNMDRVVEKLIAFTENPKELLENDQSDYIKSIALYRVGDFSSALKILDKIIAKNKNDGFLYELRGQILFESGDINGGIENFDDAIKLLDKQDSSQAKLSFSSTVLALEDSNAKNKLSLAIKRLKEASEFEFENPFLFKNLSFLYSKIGDEGRSLLALGEYNFLISENAKAKKYLKLAREKLIDKSDSKADLLRLEDIEESLKDK